MNDEQLLRYSRHLLLPQVDVSGQEKLLSSKVLIIGLGGLGSPVALYLAAAGVGQLSLCDYDKVELSNLQRQIIHDTQSVGQSKVQSAKERIAEINPDVEVKIFNKPVSEDLLNQALADIDLVIDCTDQLTVRLLINKACVKHQVRLVSGAAIRMEGQVSTFLNSGNGPCYQCLYPDIDSIQLSCAEAGVLTTTVGIIGTLQAQAALKMLMDIGTTVDGGLTIMDGMSGEWRKMTIGKDVDCPICNS